MWFDEICKLENERKQALLDTTLQNLQQIELKKTFPDISFDDLQKQNSHLITNDNCCHYIHKITGNVYSWHNRDNSWLPLTEKEFEDKLGIVKNLFS